MSFINSPVQVIQNVCTHNRAALRATIAIIGLLGFSSSGYCQGRMFGPSDGEYIGYWTDSVEFSGYSTTANATIKIQAKNSSGQWKTIATATSSSNGWRGIYYWSTTSYISTQYWSYYGYNSIYDAEIRAVKSGGWASQQLGSSIVVYGWSGGGS